MRSVLYTLLFTAWLALAVTNSYGDTWFLVRLMTTTMDVLLMRYYFIKITSSEKVIEDRETELRFSIVSAVGAGVFLTLFGTELYNGTLVIGFGVVVTIMLFFMFYLTRYSHMDKDET